MSSQSGKQAIAIASYNACVMTAQTVHSHLQAEVQSANLDHSKRQLLVLPQLPRAQGTDERKECNGYPNNEVNTDLYVCRSMARCHSAKTAKR